jgi:hypothetical protein
VVRGGSTGSDVTERHVTGNDVRYMTGSDHVRMRNRFPRIFLTIVVVQNVPLRMTDITTGCDVTEGVPLEGWSVRMRNQKLHNIRPSGVFSPEVTSSNVT